MSMSPRLLRPRQTLHPEAASWAARVVANGGSVGASLSAVDKFCKAIASAGIRDRFYRLNLFCGTGLNACLTPLYRAASLGDTQLGNATDTNSGGLFVTANYNETGASGGLLGDGSSKYLNTGLAPNALPVFATGHLSAYAMTGFGGSTIYSLIGSLASGYGENYFIEANRSPGDLAGSWGGGSFANLATAAQGAGVGHTIVSRTSSTSLRAYKNGTTLNTSTSSVTPAANANSLFVFAHNNLGGGTALNHLLGRMGGYSVGASLDDTQAAAFSTAMQAFQTALTRNV